MRKFLKSGEKRPVKKYIEKNRMSLAVIAVALLVSVTVNGYEILTSPGALVETALGSGPGAVSKAVNGDQASGPPQISASQAIVIDGDTGKALYEKNPDEKAYPASTTKIMTALIAIEVMEGLDSPLDQRVTIPAAAVGIEGSSIYLSAEEKVRMIDLLYGMMLRSGNDAATAVAEIIGGSTEDKEGKIVKTGVENFVERMNRRAEELGCTGTHFVNPSGLFDEDHYTTVRDMAAIGQAAMKNETFREIVAAPEYRAEREADKYNYFYNKNKTVHQYQGGTGIKIGFTKASGRTLVASSEREGRSLICVVMNAPDWFRDAYSLMDYCFENK